MLQKNVNNLQRTIIAEVIFFEHITKFGLEQATQDQNDGSLWNRNCRQALNFGGYQIKPYPEALLFLTTDTQQMDECHCRGVPLINHVGLNPLGR